MTKKQFLNNPRCRLHEDERCPDHCTGEPCAWQVPGRCMLDGDTPCKSGCEYHSDHGGGCEWQVLAEGNEAVSRGDFDPDRTPFSEWPKDVQERSEKAYNDMMEAISNPSEYPADFLNSIRPKPTGPTLRKQILDEAAKCVTKDRQNSYGDAEDNFADIAAKWNVSFKHKLKEPLTATDVAIAMIDTKTCRMITSPNHIDNWVDCAGYAACGGGIELRKKS